MFVTIKDQVDNEIRNISIPAVNTSTLNKILEFCDHIVIHKNEPPKIEKPLTGDLKDIINEWYNNFINL